MPFSNFKVRRETEVGYRALGNVIDFADAFRPIGSNSSSSTHYDDYVSHAHFDRRGRFKTAGLLDELSQQGLHFFCILLLFLCKVCPSFCIFLCVCVFVAY
jgi:hypothetical protein